MVSAAKHEDEASSVRVAGPEKGVDPPQDANGTFSSQYQLYHDILLKMIFKGLKYYEQRLQMSFKKILEHA
jgi:hypothetical protein